MSQADKVINWIIFGKGDMPDLLGKLPKVPKVRL